MLFSFKHHSSDLRLIVSIVLRERERGRGGRDGEKERVTQRILYVYEHNIKESHLWNQTLAVPAS